jgi:hypothetical protein
MARDHHVGKVPVKGASPHEVAETEQATRENTSLSARSDKVSEKLCLIRMSTEVRT